MHLENGRTTDAEDTDFFKITQVIVILKISFEAYRYFIIDNVQLKFKMNALDNKINNMIMPNTGKIFHYFPFDKRRPFVQM